MLRDAFLLAIALLLAGCAGLRSPSLSDSDLEERQVIQLINYAQRIAAMTADQQRREYSAGNQAFARDKDVMSRMQLALLLATPGASVQDAARAATLLEPMVASSEAASPLRSLARLIYVQLNERASEQKRTSQMREQIEARKETERTLRQQLEALKEVERNIMERGQESQPRHR
jgi:hypothetical protein